MCVWFIPLCPSFFLAPLIDMEHLVASHAADARTLGVAYHDAAPPNKAPPLPPPPLRAHATPQPPLLYKAPPPLKPPPPPGPPPTQDKGTSTPRPTLSMTHIDTLQYLRDELSKIAEIVKNIEQTCSTIREEQYDMHNKQLFVSYKLDRLLMERTEAQHQDQAILWL